MHGLILPNRSIESNQGAWYGTSPPPKKNNERPETLSSPGRPGSPPPEPLSEEIKTVM